MDVRFLLQGRGSLELPLDPATTIRDLKPTLSEKASVPVESLVFLHLGRVLGDDDALSSLKLDVRPYIFVGFEGLNDLSDQTAQFSALFGSIPAPKVIKYRGRLNDNPHTIKAIALKVCRGDTALADRLVAAPDAFLQHIGVDQSLFRYRLILRDEEETEPPYPPPPPPEEDHTFDSYPVNVMADDWSAHRPAEEQPELPDRAAQQEETRLVLTARDIDNLRRLGEIGLPLEAALPLYLRFDRDLEATARAGLLMMALGGRH
jgi:hypothetical protein